MKTNTVWKSGHEFESFDSDRMIVVDGNRKNGFNPKALLLSALAACSGIDVVDILAKMRVEFSGLEIEVEADQTQEHPRVFRDIHMRFSVKGDPGSREKFIRAIDLSLEKYCGVAAMLRKNSSIEYTLEIGNE